ncbi:15606_t:CDS:1, partial [Acaulospora colombiana]
DRDNTPDSEISEKGAQKRNTSNRKELRGIRRRAYLRNLRNGFNQTDIAYHNSDSKNHWGREKDYW